MFVDIKILLSLVTQVIDCVNNDIRVTLREYDVYLTFTLIITENLHFWLHIGYNTVVIE